MSNINKPVCVFQSPLMTRSGYGGWGMAIAKSLLRYGKYDLKIAPTAWGGCPKKININEFDPNDAEVQQLLKCVLMGPLQKQPELYIQMTIPNEFQPIGKYNIGMTAGIETTIPPGEWMEGLNRMNLNIVTSKHAKKVFDDANFVKQFQDGRPNEPIKNSRPMEVCFWGADTSIYKKTEEKCESLESALSVIPEKFAYLFVGQWTNSNGLFADRKDIGNLIKTFCNAFADKKGDLPCLILKTSGINFSKTDKEQCLSRIKDIRALCPGKLPNVYLLHGELTDVEMNALFNHEKIKAHVSFTHGEGYGHPLLLATLSGKPLLVSNWSGHLDFLNPDLAMLLPGNIKQIDPSASNQWLIPESGWFTVAYSLAESMIRDMYYNYKPSLVNAEKLRVENESKFNMVEMDKVFHAYLDKYVPTFSIEQKIVLPKLKKLELPKLNKIELPKKPESNIT